MIRKLNEIVSILPTFRKKRKKITRWIFIGRPKQTIAIDNTQALIFAITNGFVSLAEQEFSMVISMFGVVSLLAIRKRDAGEPPLRVFPLRRCFALIKLPVAFVPKPNQTHRSYVFVYVQYVHLFRLMARPAPQPHIS